MLSLRRDVIKFFNLVQFELNFIKNGGTKKYKEWLIFSKKELSNYIDSIKQVLEQDFETYFNEKKKFENENGYKHLGKITFLFDLIEIRIVEDEKYIKKINELFDECINSDDIDSYLDNVDEKLDVKIEKIKYSDIPESINSNLLELLIENELIIRNK